MIVLAGVKEADNYIHNELTDAKIPIVKLPDLLRSKGEVPYTLIGQIGHWTFERAWRYYVCKGPGIPLEQAQSLFEQWGNDIRVNGDCGSPNPKEALKGFGVGLYHVDTEEGLRALGAMIREIYIRNGFGDFIK